MSTTLNVVVVILGLCAAFFCIKFIFEKIKTLETREYFASLRENPSPAVVCVYAYYEKNEEYKHNLVYFLDNGGILPNIDYYLVINGTCTIDLDMYTKKHANITVIRRENQGFDFGGWQNVIKHHLHKSYDYYVFINSSVIGPYHEREGTWLDAFLPLFTSGKDVKLVGTSINILDDYSSYGDNFLRSIYQKEGPYAHVQSMFFILNQEGFDYLNQYGFFDDEETLNHITDIHYMVQYKEIMMSQLILKHGWNINCILSKYRDLDYRKVDTNINPSGTDPYYRGSYFGETIQPGEVVFYKAYRLPNIA